MGQQCSLRASQGGNPRAEPRALPGIEPFAGIRSWTGVRGTQAEQTDDHCSVQKACRMSSSHAVREPRKAPRLRTELTCSLGRRLMLETEVASEHDGASGSATEPKALVSPPLRPRASPRPESDVPSRAGLLGRFPALGCSVSATKFEDCAAIVAVEVRFESFLDVNRLLIFTGFSAKGPGCAGLGTCRPA